MSLHEETTTLDALTKTAYGAKRVKDLNLTPSLDWDVKEEFLYDSKGNKIAGYKHLMRSDNDLSLSVTKKSYNTMSVKEFTGVVERLMDVTGLELLGYNGAYQNGRKVLAYLAKANGEGTQLAGSKMNYYMIVGNGYDYISPFFTGLTTSYLRCANQFSMLSGQHKVRHTASKDYRVEELISYYEQYARTQEALNDRFQKFIDTPVTKDDREEFLNYVMDVPMVEGKPTPSTRKTVLLEELGCAVVKETKQLGTNLWGLFNGATWWTTHQHPTKDRVFGNVFGSNSEYNERAYTFCKNRVEGLK
jgi:hypothetical protein